MRNYFGTSLAALMHPEPSGALGDGFSALCTRSVVRRQHGPSETAADAHSAACQRGLFA
jgi:hypothetical protein